MRELTLKDKQAMLASTQAEEKLGYMAMDWANKMGEAVQQQPRSNHPEVLRETLRTSGHLDAAVHLLDRVSRQPCDCKARLAEENAHDPDWFFADWHHDCLPYRARMLLQKLSPAPVNRRLR